MGEAFLDPVGVGLQASTVAGLGTQGQEGGTAADGYPGLVSMTATATPDRWGTPHSALEPS